MRLVVDTNVLVSGFLWGGRPRSFLRTVYRRNTALFTSPEILAELTDVLLRRKFASRIANSRLSAEGFIKVYASQSTSLRPLSTPRIVSDADDDVVIGTALAANADLIVTGDKALLLLAQYRGVRIVSVTEALRLLDAD